jgi:hypothetical protein
MQTQNTTSRDYDALSLHNAIILFAAWITMVPAAALFIILAVVIVFVIILVDVIIVLVDVIIDLTVVIAHLMLALAEALIGVVMILAGGFYFLASIIDLYGIVSAAPIMVRFWDVNILTIFLLFACVAIIVIDKGTKFIGSSRRRIWG